MPWREPVGYLFAIKCFGLPPRLAHFVRRYVGVAIVRLGLLFAWHSCQHQGQIALWNFEAAVSSSVWPAMNRVRGTANVARRRRNRYPGLTLNVCRIRDFSVGGTAA